MQSSSYQASEQANGVLLVVEWHTDTRGYKHPRIYYAPAGFDPSTVLAAHAALLDAILIEIDCFQAVYGSQWNFEWTYASNNDIAAFMVAEYRKSKAHITIALGRRIIEWITNNRFTEAQVRGAFGLSLANWNTLKSQIQAWIADDDAVEAADGSQ